MVSNYCIVFYAFVECIHFYCICNIGHIKLRRTTAAEKEEQKKKEKELKRIRYEDECVASTWVKYSLGLHHQVISVTFIHKDFSCKPTPQKQECTVPLVYPLSDSAVLATQCLGFSVT